MKTLLIALVTTFIVCSLETIDAQSFDIPMEGFSRKKTSYFYMEDGSEETGTLYRLKRKKGLVKEVVLKNEEGDKKSLSPSNIDYMYLPPSKIAKFSAKMEKVSNMDKWDDQTTMDTTLLNEGYVYFEKVKTQVRNKTMDLMLQLMNSAFSSQIKVYHDPFSQETMSVGVAGIDVAGGLDKSYYIRKVKEEKAYKLHKRDYKTEFKKLFGDNEAFMEEYADKVNWNEFDEHVFHYTRMTE